MICSLLLGYFLSSERASFKNKFFDKNFSNKEILISIIALMIMTILEIPNVNGIILIFTLFILILTKLKIQNLSKILFIIILIILFQYISSYFSSARRDILKIFFITAFFLSLYFKHEKKNYLYYFIMFLITLLFIFYTTYLRTDWQFEISFTSFVTSSTVALSSSTVALLRNYDFMPAFENLMFIINSNDYLYGQTLFKIFVSWIPREVWFFKPEDTHTLITSLRENSFVGGTAAAVTLLGEIYWNFSFFGVFILFLLIGYFLRKFDLAINKKLSDTKLILFSNTTYLFFLIWRGSISTTLVIFMINIFTIFFLLYMSKIILKFYEKKN
jgi:oligosaccharide repeat unit polymerase